MIAALNNAHARRVFAQLTLEPQTTDLGDILGSAQKRRALEALVKARLVEKAGDTYRVRGQTFADLLAATPRPERRSGPERFLDGQGEIDRYPSDPAELRGLLVFVADQVITPDEALSEKELGTRLRRFGPDTAALRRHLVDAAVLQRTRSGSQYSRAPLVAGGQTSADPSSKNSCT